MQHAKEQSNAGAKAIVHARSPHDPSCREGSIRLSSGDAVDTSSLWEAPKNPARSGITGHVSIGGFGGWETKKQVRSEVPSRNEAGALLRGLFGGVRADMKFAGYERVVAENPGFARDFVLTRMTGLIW